jgi:hypothetical protein
MPHYHVATSSGGYRIWVHTNYLPALGDLTEIRPATAAEAAIMARITAGTDRFGDVPRLLELIAVREVV